MVAKVTYNGEYTAAYIRMPCFQGFEDIDVVAAYGDHQVSVLVLSEPCREFFKTVSARQLQRPGSGCLQCGEIQFEPFAVQCIEHAGIFADPCNSADIGHGIVIPEDLIAGLWDDRDISVQDS